MTSHSNQNSGSFCSGRRFGRAAVIVAAAALLPALAVPVHAGEEGGEPAVPRVVRLTPEQLQELQKAPVNLGETVKRETVFDRIQQMAKAEEDWQEFARSRGLEVKDDSLLLEIRLDPQTALAASTRLEELGVEVHSRIAPPFMNAWVPVQVLDRIRTEPSVLSVRPARRVRTMQRAWPEAGSVISEGVELSGAIPYHDLGADGEGITIAVIDGGFANWATRQGTGDWPPAENLRRFEIVYDSGAGTLTAIDCDVGTCPTYNTGNHGTATVEIAYDTAPGATFVTYKTRFLIEWYGALLHASNHWPNGGIGVADVISVSLGAPLDGIGDGSACPPHWGDPCWTVAEASEIARAQGSLVVNAAGNEREDHWGGLYVPSTGDPDTHAWDGANHQVNYFGPEPGFVWCIPDGNWVFGELFWNDWTNVDHDYDLYLLEYQSDGWLGVASSTYAQDGSPGQTPQEALQHLTDSTDRDPICQSRRDAVYGFIIDRYDAATNRNLQFFYSLGLPLVHWVPERSLGFPADSPAVFAVGALSLYEDADGETQAYYSSEGPALGPGGSLSPADHPKLDGMSFADVSTVTYGSSHPNRFAGTSASAPHVAGVAAILAQLRNEKPVVRGDQPDGLSRALELAALADGATLIPAPAGGGHDPAFGYGRIVLQECEVNAGITAGFNLVSLPCDRRTQNTAAGVFGAQLGELDTDWALWFWDADEGAYERIHSDTEPLELGRGYWIYRFDPAPSAEYTGLVADRSEAYPFTVTGSNGLGIPHMVGNPRPFAIPWNQVRFFYDDEEHDLEAAFDDDMVRNFMWTWNRATQQYEEFDGLDGEGVIEPGEGFWIRALDNVEVRLPAEVSPAESMKPGLSRDIGLPGPDRDWTIDLVVEAGSHISRVRLGHRRGASDGFDRFDAEHMPVPGIVPLRLSFPNLDWGEYSAHYMRDIRAHKNRDEWRLQVDSPEGGRVVLRWEGPDQLLAGTFLVDEENGRPLPVRRLDGRYEFTMEPGTRYLRWQVGPARVAWTDEGGY